MEQHETISAVDSLVSTLNERADIWMNAYINSQALFWTMFILSIILMILVLNMLITALLWKRRYKIFKKSILKEVIKFLQQHK